MDKWGGGTNTIDKFMSKFANQLSSFKSYGTHRKPCTAGELCFMSGPNTYCPAESDGDCKESGPCCPPPGNTSYAKMNAIFGVPEKYCDLVTVDPKIGYGYMCQWIATLWSFSDPAFDSKQLAPALLKKS